MDTPALDFCRKVQVWQENEANKTAGLVVVMPDREDDSLAALLRSFGSLGATRGLEDRARMWLIGYRELEDEQQVLTVNQRAELHAVTDRLMADYKREHKPPRARTHRRIKPWQWLVAAAAGLIIGFGTAGIVHLIAGTGNGSPPPAGPVAQAPQNPAPGALTDLQQFRADWRIPAAATADAGNPHQLVLLQDGLYYPAPWAIPPGDPGWAANTSSGITAANVSQAAGTADVTDANGTTWTVAAGQPFVLASDPSQVFRILRDGTIQAMPQPHAITVRTGI